MKIPVAANIGEILENVINDCPQVRELWKITEKPIEDFGSSVACENVCGSIAQAFAEHSVKAEKVPWSPEAEKVWGAMKVAHRMIFLVSAIGVLSRFAMSRNPNAPELQNAFNLLKEHELSILAAESVAIFSKPVMDVIRMGLASPEVDSKRDDVRQVVFNSLRSGLV